MSDELRLLVCGPRDWTNEPRIALEIERRISEGMVVITGGAKGVDSIASKIATAWRLDQILFSAEWGKYGRVAGPIRNQQMLDEGKPTLVLAFQYKDRKTPGTQDMIRRARKAGIPVEVVEV